MISRSWLASIELGSSEQHPGYSQELGAGGTVPRPGTPFQEVRRLDMKNERLPEMHIEYTRNPSRPASGSNTPQHYSQVIYDEPGSYEDAGYGHEGYRVGRGSIGTTYATNPSMRRRTIEEQKEILRKLASFQL